MSGPRDAATIESEIVRFVRDELLGGDDVFVDPDENLFTSGLVDSVGVVRLIAHLQTRFGVKIPPADLVPDNFRTVRVMTRYLQAFSRDG